MKLHDLTRPPPPALLKLNESAGHIRAALEWMLASPPTLRPFVMIEEAKGQRYVQFVGDTEQPLKIDTGYQAILSPHRHVNEPCELDDAPRLAAEVLEHGLSLAYDAEVVINPCIGA